MTQRLVVSHRPSKNGRSWRAILVVALTVAVGLFVTARLIAGSVLLVERLVDIPRAVSR